MRACLTAGYANPVVLWDEISRAGGHTRGSGGTLRDALTTLLEPANSCRYRDPYLQADVDLSRVQWILTANSLDSIPRPLLDRCLILRLDEPGPQHLRQLATSILAEVRADRGLDELWAPSFDGVEWAALEANWAKGGSLRALRRLVETVLDARESGLRQ